MNSNAAKTLNPASHNTAVAILDTVREAAHRLHISTLARQIEACEACFKENQLIDIAILGQFKAGKTSFINSLIGRPLLPVGVVPVTTVITRITRVQYGAKEKATVTFLDGRQSEIGLQEIEAFISEAQNPANQKNVAVLDVNLPIFEHYHGLRFVDTPGLGSAYKYNTATSENWLPRVGAAIVAISSDRPLSESDLNLLRELMEYTPEIIILLTKVDLLAPEQQNEVVTFLKNTIKRELNREFPVFLYSTKNNTDHYRKLLDTTLLGALSQNSSQELEKIIKHKVRSLAESCLGYLEVALKASLHKDYDQDKLKNLILDEKLNYELLHSELFLIAREQIVHTREIIASRLYRNQQQPLTSKIRARLAEEMTTWKGNLSHFTRHYEHWMAESMKVELQSVSESEHHHFYDTLNKAQAGISRSLYLFKNYLDRNIEKVLGIRLAEADWKIEVAAPTHTDITFTRSFDFHLDLLWFLFPMFIFRSAFEKHFLNQVPWAVEVNLSRLAYQWEVRVNKAIEEIKNKALAYVQDELSTVESLLSKAHGQTDELQESIRKLQSYLK
jgi:GTP-binding protein EngB required for normal cell division